MIAITQALLAAATLIGAWTASSSQTAHAPLTLSDIEWRVAPGATRRNGATSLRLSRRGQQNATIPASAAPSLASAIEHNRSGTVAFTIDREPGTINCTGTLRSGEGRGKCRFVSSQAFERGLATRRLELKSRDGLFGMALVSATLAHADDLKRAGVGPDDAGDLTAAAALDVSGGYALGLRRAGLQIDTLDDLIACHALGVDAAFVRGLVAMGYDDLRARQAIGMKAVGVTPDYARAVNAAVRRSVNTGGAAR